MGGGPQMPNNLNHETMRKVMEIMQSSEKGEITEEQRTQLQDLGLSDEEINKMLQMEKQRNGL